MPTIEAGDVLGAFTTAMDIYLLAKRNKEEAHARALKAGYTESELATIRDNALTAFMEPLADPLDEPESPTETGP